MFLDPKLIHNISTYKLIENQSICYLCEHLLWNPLQCSVCESSFCNECLKEYFLKNDKSCPNNCINPTFKESKLLNEILSKLQFNCPNKCNDIIPYEEFFSHLNSKCSKVDYKKKYLELKDKLNQLKSEYKLWVPEPSSHLKNSTFKSKFHVHRLPYIETIERGGWLCNVCRESYKASEKSYYCTLCDYDLCKNCKENEEKEIMNKF